MNIVQQVLEGVGAAVTLMFVGAMLAAAYAAVDQWRWGRKHRITRPCTACDGTGRVRR